MKKYIPFLCLFTFFFYQLNSQTHLGNGSDGALTVTNGQTLVLDSVRAGVTGNNPAGTNVLNITDGSGFNANDEVLIITMQDADTNMGNNSVGQYEFNYVVASSNSQLVLKNNISGTYNADATTKHQVVRVPNFTDLTVAGTLTCSSWDGLSGGILIFRVNGVLTINGTGIVDANGKGYRGGTQFGSSHGGGQGGESFTRPGGNGGSYNNNNAQVGAGGGGAAYYNHYGANGLNGGGGGGTLYVVGKGSRNLGGAGGGGGGHAGCGGGAGYGSFGYGGDNYNSSGSGQNGGNEYSGDGGLDRIGGGGGGGGTYGTAELTKIYFGSGGGCAGRHDGYNPGFGGNGGGIVMITAKTIVNDGLISSAGNDGGYRGTYSGGGGAGAGGSVYIQCNSLENNGNVLSEGGSGGAGYYGGSTGGDGGNGRIRLDYFEFTNTGNVTPTAYQGSFINISTERLPNTPVSSGTYTVSALVFDTDGDPITSASLYYRVNGGGFVQVSMGTSDNELFSANIPAQSVNSTIDYYVTATDGTDNYSDPLIAPTGFYSFSVTAQAPYGLTITDNNNTSVELNWNTPSNITNFVDYSVFRSETQGFTPGVANRIALSVATTSYTDNSLSDLHTYYYVVSANYNISSTNVSANSGEASVTVNDTAVTTVSGYVYLEDELNHANIKVLMVPASPAAQPDSVYTNASGFFEIAVIPGIYDIIYSKEDYRSYNIITNLSIIEDLYLDESTLSYLGTSLSGNISGVLDGIYSVDGDITVLNGDSLIIQPGTEFRFNGNYNLFNYGYIEGNGTSLAPILFTSAPLNQVKAKGQWQGIDFYNESDDSSVLDNLIVQYAVNGIHLENASPEIMNTHIHHCSNYGLMVYEDGSDPVLTNIEINNCTNHGMHVYRGDPTVTYLNTHNNSGYGAYWQESAYGSIKHSSFNNNSSYGYRGYNYASPRIDSCEFLNNYSWGMHMDYYCSSFITNSRIAENYGHGVSFNYNSGTWIAPRFRNNIVEDNLFHGILAYRYVREDAYITDNIIRNNGNSGIYVYNYGRPNILNNIITGNGDQGILVHNSGINNPVIRHNVIAYNASDGIYKDNTGNPTIEYNTIYGNGGDGLDINYNGYTETITNNIIVNNTGWGVRANTAIEVFQYNNVYGNQSGELSNTANFPVETWNFISTNYNGTSADIYLNISQEPSFVFTDSLDFNLSGTSLCVDAGDNAVSDPDGSISDIGALYHDQGNPHVLMAISYGHESVSLEWEAVENDSILSYNVYYKTSAASTFVFFGNTVDLSHTVTSLTNNTAYDFTVRGVYAGSESANSPIVTETPGEPHVNFNPGALNLLIDADTVNQNILISNTGSKDLDLSIYNGTGAGYAHFDGSGDRIQIGDQSHLENMTELTIEAWVRRAGNGHFEFAGKNYRNYSMYIASNNRFGIYKGFGGGNLYQNWTTPYELPVNEWHHLAVSWSGNIIKFFADGELIAEYDNVIDMPIPNNTYSFDIGRRGGENNYYINGDVAEVRVWNVQRSQDDIRETKDVMLNGNETGLVGYWPLTSNYNDYSVYGANGTNYGNTYISSNLRTGAYAETPFILSDQHFNLAPGVTDTLEVKFYDDGSSGTKVYKAPIYTNINDTSLIEYEIALTFGTQVPSTPVYFTPVAETGLPYTIIITDAEIDDVNIQVGDEIGIFDDTLCVGAGIFDGTFNFVITAWQEDTAEAELGFVPGDTILYRIYDASAALEATVTEANYSVGNGTFGYGAFSALSLESTIYKIQDVELTQNQFKLISFNRLPRYPAAATIFGSMDSLEIAYNDEGKAYIPEYGINSLGDINFRDAFYVFSSSDDTINYSGTSINPFEWDIEVDAGRWNYVSFLGESPLAITSAFPANLVDSIDVVQTSDGDMWVPSLAVNTIGDMLPGLGYQIALSSGSDIVFNYQTNNGFKSAVGAKEKVAVKHFSYTKTGTPYNLIIENPSINGLSLEVGDEIATFDNDVCVGAVVYSGDERTVLSTWEKNEDYSLPGFSADNEITLKVYSGKYKQIVEALPQAIGQDNPELKYKVGNYARLTFDVFVDASSVATEIAGTNLKVMPNPFKENVQFKFYLDNDAHVVLDITNILGQRIAQPANGMFETGYHTIEWGTSSKNYIPIKQGIYHYTLIIDQNKYSGKLVFIE